MDGADIRLQSVIKNIEKVVVGKRDEIILSIVAFLAKGHVLLEDVPGVGKTMLVKAIAKSLGAKFKRIQFTPDLLPSDVTGASIYNQKKQTFEFRPGPIMANMVLADEINRTSPKTQAALLEALEESHVTVDGETMPLPAPFFVMATQNPIEYAGTYPLPEAQLDRFLFKIKMGYPNEEEEMEILTRIENNNPLDGINAVLSTDDVIEMQTSVQNVYVDNLVKSYIVRIVNVTRNHPSIRLGVSPRGAISILKAAQAYAFLQGRDYVIPDDVKYLAPYTWSHRMVLKSEIALERKTQEDVLRESIAEVPIPAKKKDAIR